jgi:MFS family permease
MQTGVWLVRWSGIRLFFWETSLGIKIFVVGSLGLLSMLGAIIIGVYFGAWTGIGQEAPRHKSFIWWVINRLLFLAAIGSIQGFALFYLNDVIKIADPATQTTYLLGTVALFLLPAAIGGGILADRLGRKRLVGLAGLIACLGTSLLLFAENMSLVILSGGIIGLGTGIFMSSNWALGTDLVPSEDAGKFLGISNLAGAGAGIIGAGIGGPIADFFNGFQQGLGYLVIIAIYGILFLTSTIAITQIKQGR